MARLLSRLGVAPGVVRVLAPSLVSLALGIVLIAVAGAPTGGNVTDDSGDPRLWTVVVDGPALFLVVMGGIGIAVAAVVWVRGIARGGRRGRGGGGAGGS